MSESTSEDFSDSDSDVSQDEKPKQKAVPQGKRKVQKKQQDSDDSDDDSDGDDEAESKPQPVKKRKTLQDYMNEKVSSAVEYSSSVLLTSLESTFRSLALRWKKLRGALKRKKKRRDVLATRSSIP